MQPFLGWDKMDHESHVFMLKSYAEKPMFLYWKHTSNMTLQTYINTRNSFLMFL